MTYWITDIEILFYLLSDYSVSDITWLETLLLRRVKLKVSLSHVLLQRLCNRLQRRDSPTYKHMTVRLTVFFFFFLTAQDKRQIPHLHVLFLQNGRLFGEDLIGLDTFQALLPHLLLQRFFFFFLLFTELVWTLTTTTFFQSYCFL